MKEAQFYNKLAEKKIKCDLCPHNCLIADGKRGICGVRENQSGSLSSLVYGKVVASHIDPIEKKPLFHFLPGSRSFSIATVGCNLRCDFCQNYEIAQTPREEGVILGEEATPAEVVDAAVRGGCQSISYTYTEPTIYYEYAYDCALLAHAKGIKNIFVTNGFINREPVEHIAPYLSAANVDLKSFNDDYYRRYCGGRLQPVLETLQLLSRLKIWFEVTTLIIPGLNDFDEELVSIARFIKDKLGSDVPWHVSAFRPTYKMLDRPATPAATLAKARDIGLKSGLKYVYVGNIYLEGSEDTYCPHCRKAVIRRSGFSVLTNDLRGNNCSFCGELISGVWG